MARSSISTSSKKICSPNKFSLLNGCTSWSTILAFLALLALCIICYIILTNKQNKLAMIANNINNKPVGNHFTMNVARNNVPNKETIGLKRIEPLYEGMDPLDDEHDNTGTPTSKRIKYDINVNIRDSASYLQNPNIISYGRYEAEKNIERIINPMLPPERSYENTYGIPINIPSRGPFQSYQQIGSLSKENIIDTEKLPGNNNETNILPLFGRPTYTGSNRWNYYTSSDKFQSVKLPINIDGRKCTEDLGCNELRDGDMVSIPSYNGKFKVELYDFDKPRYIPYVY